MAGGLWDPDSSVSIVTRLQIMDSVGFESCQLQEIFLQNFKTNTASYSKGAGIISGGWGGGKRPGPDVDLSPPSSVEINLLALEFGI